MIWKDWREPNKGNFPPSEVIHSPGSQAWSHTAQVGPEEQRSRDLPFRVSTRPTMLRRAMASRAEGLGPDSRTLRPRSMYSHTFAQSSQRGSVDRHAQVPPGVRVPGTPTELVATPRHLGFGAMRTLPPPLMGGRAGAGLRRLPGPRGQIPTGPASWRQMGGNGRGPGHRKW